MEFVCFTPSAVNTTSETHGNGNGNGVLNHLTKRNGSAAAMDIIVALPSGQDVLLTLAPESSVGWLKCVAQQRLKTKGLLQLVTKEGQMLSPQRCLWEEGLQDGDSRLADVLNIGPPWSAHIYCRIHTLPQM